MSADFNTAVLNDHDLLHQGLVDLFIENRAGARRWARLVELHRRRHDTAGNFSATAREWTAWDTSEAWALSDNYARHELNVALFLGEHLSAVFEMCMEGSLDRFRAVTIADIVRHRLDDPADWQRVGERLVPFLRRHRRSYPDLGVALVTCTLTELRNKLNYETRILQPVDEEFTKAFAERTVRAHEFEDGIGQLHIGSSVDEVRLARHRLHLCAKELRAAGDERTIEQLMSDLAMDLLIGRATKEGATWFRMLTDPAGEPVSLSTKSYQPTGPIWRYIVATRPTCAHPGCDRPSVECELDHEVPWPAGQTSTENLQPLCRRHHKAKHARAEGPGLDWEYGWAS